MLDVQINLSDATYNGAIMMSSTTSKFIAIRTERSDTDSFTKELGHPGIYFLMVGTDSVYVGETDLQSILTRINSTHTGTIDASWHTLLAFPCISGISLSQNELLYIENAMCEFAQKKYSQCLTTTPSPKNCNASYRNSHYGLSGSSIKACKQYIEDIKHYISLFPSIFPQTTTPSPAPKAANTELFYYDNPSVGVSGKAEIEIHCGHTKKRKAILKKGSTVSTNISNAFRSHTAVLALRTKLEKQGKLINRVLQEDIEFDSQSGAGEFLNGTSFDGNTRWKTVNGDVPLKSLL